MYTYGRAYRTITKKIVKLHRIVVSAVSERVRDHSRNDRHNRLAGLKKQPRIYTKLYIIDIANRTITKIIVRLHRTIVSDVSERVRNHSRETRHNRRKQFAIQNQ